VTLNPTMRKIFLLSHHLTRDHQCPLRSKHSAIKVYDVLPSIVQSHLLRKLTFSRYLSDYKNISFINFRGCP